MNVLNSKYKVQDNLVNIIEEGRLRLFEQAHRWECVTSGLLW